EPVTFLNDAIIAPQFFSAPVSSQLLLKLIVDQLMDFSTEPSVFNMFMEQLKKTYFNILIKHDRLGRDVRLLILEPHRWSVIQKYRALTEGLSIQQLTAFVAALKSELYAEGLVQGNFTSAEAAIPASGCRGPRAVPGGCFLFLSVFESGLRKLREHALMELMVVCKCKVHLRSNEVPAALSRSLYNEGCRGSAHLEWCEFPELIPGTTPCSEAIYLWLIRNIPVIPERETPPVLL
ncbi:hypothetical protein XENOCAPTIV_017335, partial [Xenoophorus captivus]